MGAAAPAAALENSPVESIVPVEEARAEETAIKVAVTDAQESTDQMVTVSKSSVSLDGLRDSVLNALSGAGHRMLVSMLDPGQWSIEGSEVVVKVAASPTVIDMSLGADARRLAIATASGTLGKAVKVKVISGGVAQKSAPNARSAPNGSTRGRAEQDPIVRRMQEKFGAEIRTVIDQRDKR
jgi:DNA polymerase-3 subunit gamma/tau